MNRIFSLVLAMGVVILFTPAAEGHGLCPWMNAPAFGRDVAPLGRKAGCHGLCPWGSTQPGFAQVQKTAGHDVQTPDRVNVETEDGTATVVSIDYENRTGTLRLPDGTMLTFKAGGEMSNFDQVKAGDHVIIRK